MRKIEEQMNRAVRTQSNWSNSNSQVTFNESTNCSQVYLHGHQIAVYDHNTNAVKLSSCGYETVTTKSRLNALLEEFKYGAKVFQKNWNWFIRYNGQTQSFWDGVIILDGIALQTV